MKNLKLSLSVIAVAAFAGLLWLAHARPHTEQIPADPRLAMDQSTWVTLTDENFGLRLKVPPSVSAYATPMSPGCQQKLILGADADTYVSLMPEFPSCELGVESNANVSDFEDMGDGLDTRITVLPVDSIDEITGYAKARIAENRIIGSIGPGTDSTACALESLHAVIGQASSNNPDATVPVRLLTNGCALNEYAFTVRYSPTHHKAIFFEAPFVRSVAGGYYVNPDAAGNRSADLAIYASAEIYK